MNQSNIEKLLQIIEALDTAYELGEDCINPETGKIVTDAEYDIFKKELTELLLRYDPNHNFLKKPSLSKVSDNVNRVKHDPPMTSLSKSNGTLDEKNDILSNWMTKCFNELNYNKNDDMIFFAQSYKRDGVALALYYENGKLVKAGLRPHDGIYGEDVTENAKYVEGVLEELPEPITCSIRGEVECKISTFNQINEELEKNGEKTYANPRNYTAGSIRQFKDPTETKKRKLSFVGYTIENLDNPPYKTAIQRAKWCNKTLNIPFVRIEPFNYNKLQEMEDNAPNLDYEVDGIVIEVNNLEDQEQLGKHGNSETANPKGKIAWKFAEQSATVEVKNITWNTGRQGNVTPVLEFDPVKLAGTFVSKCTAHNVGIILNKKIGVGAKVKIIKSGKIIPKVIDVVQESNNVTYPKICPSCGEPLELVENNDSTDLVCRNPNCPAQAVGQFVNFLSVIGCKGVASSTITKILDSGLVKKYSDLFSECSVKNLMDIGFTERTSYLIEANIKQVASPDKIKDNKKLQDQIDNIGKIRLSLSKLISALGISNAGSGTARTLCNHFNHDIDAILNASVDELKDVADIGPITAKSVYKGLQTFKDEMYELLKYIELETPKNGGILEGKTFVFTGTFTEKRKDLQKIVEDLGGKNSGSVSKKVDYVVCGEDAGSKEQKADKLGINKIDLDGFYRLIAK